MTEEPFLSRWSRLKRGTPDMATTPAAAPADANQTVPAVDPSAATSNDAAAEDLVDLSSLPSLDAILADTDISGFLRRGVPTELTKAALRRAWVADPAVRDFIGLAENQWDFTDPEAMFGFGPLRDTDTVADLVAEAAGISTHIVSPEPDIRDGRETPVAVEGGSPTPDPKTPGADLKLSEADAAAEPATTGMREDERQGIASSKDNRSGRRQTPPNRRLGGGALPE